MKKYMLLLMWFMVCLAVTTVCFSDQTVVATKVDRSPVIDGKGDDPAWAQATEYTTYDTIWPRST